MILGHMETSASTSDIPFYEEDTTDVQNQSDCYNSDGSSTSDDDDEDINYSHGNPVCEPFSTDVNYTIMFEKSGQTVTDIMEMIVAFSLKFGVSHEARHELLEILKICAGPGFQDLKISDYKLSQIFDPPSETINFHFYCNSCTTKIFSSKKKDIKNQNMLCPSCSARHSISLSNPYIFLTVDLEYQLQLLINNDELANYFNPQYENFISANVNNVNLKDVHDSTLHRELCNIRPNTLSY